MKKRNGHGNEEIILAKVTFVALASCHKCHVLWSNAWKKERRV